MIVSGQRVKDYLRNLEVSKKYFIAVPHSSYFLIQRKDLAAIDIFYREELIKKFNLTFNEKWNCAKYAEAYKNMANIYYYKFFREEPRSLAIGNVYYTEISKEIPGVNSPLICQEKIPQKHGGHVLNIILYEENKKINHVYRDHQKREFDLTDVEKKSLELIVM